MRDQLQSRARRRRSRLGWTQHELATAIGSSVSRVSKMESGDPSVSADFMLRALRAMGLRLTISSDDSSDPMTDPALSAGQKSQLSRRMLRRATAEQIAGKHNVDVGDVEHVLANLSCPPLERLARALSRARFGK